ncbi:MAG TPA: MFS transporter [Jatrophihabitantaceae bacterium]|nr:MFS transporter [Jatrophihabitantaceae bacterium]
MTDNQHVADADAEAPTTARRSTNKTLLLFLIAGAQLMVVLDSTIVNIALPSMGRYFGKSQTDMTWAINAYTLAFGGLLLLGGRAADILGRRQMFILGLGLFSLGSLLGGLATSFEVLLAGRVVQGIGGAIAAPTALSLITTLFAEGRERNRAFAVYAGVSGGGAAIGLLLGGVLTEYFDWRWVLFVNVPIGVALMAGGFLYIHASERLSGRFDILGSLLSVTGMVALVYGFINAANHSWSQGTTVASLTAGVVLLGAFGLYESRSPIAIMPMRIFANRSRAGSYVIMLILGAALFGMFYYLTFFIQGVMGFSSLKSGLAYLPFSAIIIVGSGIVSQLLPRIGPKPLLIAGSALMGAGMFWYAQVDADAKYLSGILPAMIVTATGVAMVFVTLTVVAVTKVTDTDTGLASALLNVGQQIGGSIGLAVLATAFTSASKSEGTSQVGKLGGASQQHHLAELLGSAQSGKPASPAAYTDHTALHAFHAVQAHGASQGFLVSAIFGVVAVVAAVVLINVRKSDTAQVAELALAAA